MDDGLPLSLSESSLKERWGRVEEPVRERGDCPVCLCVQVSESDEGCQRENGQGCILFITITITYKIVGTHSNPHTVFISVGDTHHFRNEIRKISRIISVTLTRRLRNEIGSLSKKDN